MGKTLNISLVATLTPLQKSLELVGKMMSDECGMMNETGDSSALRMFEPGYSNMKQPANGFNLFVCQHHGHRVTSHECGSYKRAGACPPHCIKHPPVGRDSIPTIAQDSIPQAINKRNEAIVGLETQPTNGLFPIGRKHKREFIYYSDISPTGPPTHKRCPQCGEIKLIEDQYYIYQTGIIESWCIPCVALRDAEAYARKRGKKNRKRAEMKAASSPVTTEESSAIAGVESRDDEPAAGAGNTSGIIADTGTGITREIPAEIGTIDISETIRQAILPAIQEAPGIIRKITLTIEMA